MFEKVNPSHPDKVADRIAGALVDVAYSVEKSPRIAVEVLIGHDNCTIITESSVNIPLTKVKEIVARIVGRDNVVINYISCPQDKHLAKNQSERIKCGDNGIFKGTPITDEQRRLTDIAGKLYDKFPTDGKFVLSKGKLTICQSCANTAELNGLYPSAIINPLGDWTGGINVDSGATNRKLGSDMGDGVTGGGLCGKDLSKADVSVNIYAFLQAQKVGKPVEFSCSIGDEFIDGIPYAEIVKTASEFINEVGGFEKFAEWGLIRP